MKKQYVAPEIEIVEFDIKDIITNSLATGEGDNGGFFPDDWYAIPNGTDFQTPLG